MPVEQEQTSDAGSLLKLIEVLSEIDTSTPIAKLNEQSINDNNGGRIIL
jgi:hypothetical protein